jgi:hypothetical protein
VKRETNLVSKSLCFDGDCALICKNLCASWLRFFPVYKEARKRTRREGPRGPNDPAPCGQKVSPHVASSLAPRGPPGFHLLLKVLLFHENFCNFFSEFISEVSCMKKIERGFFVKNSVSSCSFYPSVSSILDKHQAK